MNEGLFETLGKVAGIGGVAFGVLLLIFQEVIRKNVFPKLSDESAYRAIRLILVLTFLIAALGIGAWIYVSVKTPSYHGAVEESEVKQTFESIGGTGWILLGNYDYDNHKWTFGPFFTFVHGDHPASNELPKIGDGLRVTAERHVVILDWSSSKEQRRLEAPGINKAVISGAEDFTPVILGAGALVDVGEVSAGHFNGRQDVVWARVIPMVH
jgi:hypothetical protein